MLRLGICFILISLLMGCAGPPTSTAESPIIVEPTTVEQVATNAPTSELPTTENTSTPDQYSIQEYPVPAGTHPHDVAPAPDGGIVWYTAQHVGALGWLDPATGETGHIPLGSGSAPAWSHRWS